MDLKRNMQKNTSEKVSLLTDPHSPPLKRVLKNSLLWVKERFTRGRVYWEKHWQKSPLEGFVYINNFCWTPSLPSKLAKKFNSWFLRGLPLGVPLQSPLHLNLVLLSWKWERAKSALCWLNLLYGEHDSILWRRQADRNRHIWLFLFTEIDIYVYFCIPVLIYWWEKISPDKRDSWVEKLKHTSPIFGSGKALQSANCHLASAAVDFILLVEGGSVRCKDNYQVLLLQR